MQIFRYSSRTPDAIGLHDLILTDPKPECQSHQAIQENILQELGVCDA